VTKIRQTIWRKKRLFGRPILSAFLLVLVLLLSVPLTEILASGEMDCCKGMATMSADSCANGICHLSRKPKPKRKLDEKICGAKKLSLHQILFADLQKLHLQKDNNSIFSDAGTDDLTKQANVSRLDNPVFSSSCKSDCCSSSFNFRNHRNFTYLSEVVCISQKPRPPTEPSENSFPQFSVKVLKTLHRECKPCVPPQIFS